MRNTTKKHGILLAAYGSSSLRGEAALSLFAEQARRAFPGLPVRWAYTSDRMRSRLAAAGKKTDSVKKALRRMGFERYTHVAVQSLHLIPGAEYEALLEETKSARAEGGPAHIRVGQPLLHTAEDVRLAAAALLAHLPEDRAPHEPVVCMGHGTWHTGAASYTSLAETLARSDPRIFIGTMSGSHGIDSVLPQLAACLSAAATGAEATEMDAAGAAAEAATGAEAMPNMKKGQAPRVWLLPLLSIIGKHAEEDMAGDGDESWRSRIQAAGFPCTAVLTGTVEYDGFARIWLTHLAEALKSLKR